MWIILICSWCRNYLRMISSFVFSILGLICIAQIFWFWPPVLRPELLNFSPCGHMIILKPTQHAAPRALARVLQRADPGLGGAAKRGFCHWDICYIDWKGKKIPPTMKIMSNTVFSLMTQHLRFLITIRYFKVNMKREPVLSSAETHLLLDSADFRQLIDNHKHSFTASYKPLKRNFLHQKVLLT